jgi:hypothetical protein
MGAIGPTCPVCDKAIPIRWRLGLRKSWGACPHCGFVIRETFQRKLSRALIFLLASGFIWFGERWQGSLALRGGVGLTGILVAALVLPGFEVRHERHNS